MNSENRLPISATDSLPPALITPRLLAAIRDQYRLDWHGLHGVRHWSRVLRHGLELAPLTGARVDVVALFAVFHDACRHNDDHDPAHGARGADLSTRFRGLMFDLDEAGMSLLTYACRHHSRGRAHLDMTVCTCWDSDRLDLWRVGIRPDPRCLLTAPARQSDRIYSACDAAERNLLAFAKVLDVRTSADVRVPPFNPGG